jgi:hypothetical protein
MHEMQKKMKKLKKNVNFTIFINDESIRSYFAGVYIGECLQRL